MPDKILNIKSLPSFLFNHFNTDMVKIQKAERGFLVEPIEKNQIDTKYYSCPFLGTAKGGSLTVDKFMEMKQEEKELENQNEKRLFP
jgi:hypothetical protein